MVRRILPIPDISQPAGRKCELIADYLHDRGRLAVILLDREGTILDCNPFFLENTGLTEKPIGQSINAFLAESLPTAGVGEIRIYQDVRFSFVLNNSLEQTISGHMMDIGNCRVIFAHTFRHTNNEMVAKMSRFTDESTDLTRELNKKNRELESANTRITQLMNMEPVNGTGQPTSAHGTS